MADQAFDAVILIAHGARDGRWMEPFAQIRRQLAERLFPRAVALAFMEFTQPTLADVVADVRRAGARRVLVTPVFLSAGGHVATDIPRLVDVERRRHPDVTFVVSGAVGEEPEVTAGMLDAVVRLAGA